MAVNTKECVEESAETRSNGAPTLDTVLSKPGFQEDKPNVD